MKCMQIGKSNFGKMTDEELMLHVRYGEAKAFDELYKRYGKRLLGYFLRMLNYDKNKAEDALQDLFMKIAEDPEKFDGSRKFKAWIFAIASNYCKNVYRHNEVVLDCNEEIVYLNNGHTENDFLTMASKIDAGEFRSMLEEVLNSLPGERKEAFILKYQEDKSISEIAFIQNCPEGSVKSRLHYTLKILKEKLYMFNPMV